MEDALISPEGFAILTGAGLIAASASKPVYQHVTSQIEVGKAQYSNLVDLDGATATTNLVEGKAAMIELPEVACYSSRVGGVAGYADNSYLHESADILVMVLKDGVVINEPCVPHKLVFVPEVKNAEGKVIEPAHTVVQCDANEGALNGAIVLVDYYVKRTGNAQQIEITADKFGGYYYIEASTLFRDEATGVDLPAEFIIPNGKVQSNFNFSMANSGDPSTFTFTVDAMPGYTKFDMTHKVLAAIQIIEDAIAEADEFRGACDGEVNP